MQDMTKTKARADRENGARHLRAAAQCFVDAGMTTLAMMIASKATFAENEKSWLEVRP